MTAIFLSFVLKETSSKGLFSPTYSPLNIFGSSSVIESELMSVKNPNLPIFIPRKGISKVRSFRMVLMIVPSPPITNINCEFLSTSFARLSSATERTSKTSTEHS